MYVRLGWFGFCENLVCILFLEPFFSQEILRVIYVIVQLLSSLCSAASSVLVIVSSSPDPIYLSNLCLTYFDMHA